MSQNAYNEFKEKHPFILNSILMVVAAIALFYIGLLFIDVFTSHGQERQVPDVRTMTLDNAIEALKMALRGMNPQYKEMPVIHHSDRGSQYCSLDYVKLMKKHSMEISMTEGGNPRENSVAERVNGIIKNEYLYPLQVSISGLHMRVHRAIHAYNAERPHLSLNMHTPEYVYRTGILTHRLWKNYYPYYDSLNHL